MLENGKFNIDGIVRICPFRFVFKIAKPEARQIAEILRLMKKRPRR